MILGLWSLLVGTTVEVRNESGDKGIVAVVTSEEMPNGSVTIQIL